MTNHLYLSDYCNPELFDLEQFESDLRAGNLSELQIFRDALKSGHDFLQECFQENRNASNYVRQRAWLVDQILIQVWQQHCNCLDANTCALIAVGGYGRGELHPYSDVDVLILLDSPLSETSQKCLGNFIRFLWDIRLEIGHSVRTLAECEKEAATDISIATNLIETRLLIGSESLFQAVQVAVAPDNIWSNKEFFAAKMKEQTQRHLKYDDTAYNLEPNIKEGPGGLRDIQTIGWVAKRYFGATTLHDLVEHGFLTEHEYHILTDEGQEFLFQVRCLLHFVADRHEERLLFDYQNSIAKGFGYKDDGEGLGVEKFMKQYYRTIKKISTLNDMLLQLFEEAILYAGTPAKIRPLNKRFRVNNDFIEVTHDKVFVNYPFALLEIFLLMQENPDIKGIRAATIRLIIHYNSLIDQAFRNDLRARSLFFEIFRQPQGLTHALRRMNSYGVLAAYISAFGQIVGRMQYDLFHVYTVDQHSLFVVRNLRRFTVPEFQHEFPFCSRLIQTIPKPELLYFAGLFHDIAKGRGGDHSELGEKETLDFCKAHGLSDFDARFVAWLVRHHLLMSMTVQRQDVYDPEVIKNFADIVEERMRLDYLYLLTVADIRATNPHLWNSWKEALLTTLYRKSYAVLHDENGQYLLNKQVHKKEIQEQTRRLLSVPEDKRLIALWKDLGDDYFLYSSPKDIARETEAILNEATPDNPLVLERLETRGATEFLLI
jgi:[protein-PII] uridylyltransferase